MAACEAENGAARAEAIVTESNDFLNSLIIHPKKKKLLQKNNVFVSFIAHPVPKSKILFKSETYRTTRKVKVDDIKEMHHISALKISEALIKGG